MNARYIELAIVLLLPLLQPAHAQPITENLIAQMGEKMKAQKSAKGDILRDTSHYLAKVQEKQPLDLVAAGESHGGTLPFLDQSGTLEEARPKLSQETHNLLRATEAERDASQSLETGPSDLDATEAVSKESLQLSAKENPEEVEEKKKEKEEKKLKKKEKAEDGEEQGLQVTWLRGFAAIGLALFFGCLMFMLNRGSFAGLVQLEKGEDNDTPVGYASARELDNHLNLLKKKAQKWKTVVLAAV